MNIWIAIAAGLAFACTATVIERLLNPTQAIEDFAEAMNRPPGWKVRDADRELARQYLVRSSAVHAAFATVGWCWLIWLLST